MDFLARLSNFEAILVDEVAQALPMRPAPARACRFHEVQDRVHDWFSIDMRLEGGHGNLHG